MLNGLFTICDIWLVSSYLGVNRDGCTCGAGTAHSFRNTWFHSLWEVHDFTHSLYSLYIHYILLNLSVLGLCLRINDSGLFAWISLNALSRTYLIWFAISNKNFRIVPCMNGCHFVDHNWNFGIDLWSLVQQLAKMTSCAQYLFSRTCIIGLRAPPPPPMILQKLLFIKHFWYFST